MILNVPLQMHAAVAAESNPAWPAPGRAGVRFAVVWAFLRFGGHSPRADFGTVSPERWHRGGSSGEGLGGRACVGGTSPAGQRHGHFAKVPWCGLVQVTVPPQSCAATATITRSRREQGMTHERSSLVITTKLVAPRLGRGSIDRTRLFQLVSTAPSARHNVLNA